ncbi:hypothetical protein [Sinomicrobium weinanense]|uniref:Uncharacterized protein n=1 Tax=Sinomicrobium weinanense TaxID=2842200 RepID=A0A926JQ73_9FLAO|nr:hypothetical protein [Sinomicrobium weinanense]MBC9795231.1 hypothetical protein [Sinomicrobium weinanense]MBU3122008.1 hypothetical protein [Sinomicrobium weinanense]
MWIRIKDISIKKIDATHLKNPKNPDKPMLLNLFQREGRTVLYVLKNKKVFPQFINTSTGLSIPKRRWTEEMKTFAQQEVEKVPPQKGGFKVTVFGWLFLLAVVGMLSYIVYDGLIGQPQRMKKFEQREAEMARVNEGDIFLGRIEVYKEKGSPLGMNLEFGCFKVVNIEGDVYHIAKSIEMSKTAKPLNQMNSTDFEQEAFVVKGKELGAHHKTFASDDGLTEISFRERKE